MGNKVIAIWATDIHISEKTIDVCTSIFNQLIELSIENDTCPIMLGGDIFTSRKAQPLNVLEVFDNFLNKTTAYQINTYTIAGNHDKVDYFSQKSYLDIFHQKRFFISRGYLSNNFSHEDDFFDSEDVYFHFLPYYDESVYLDYLKRFELDKEKKNYLFTHIAINGVKNNDGTKVTNAIPVSAFEHFDKVFVGHYHDHQEFENIIYTGSAYQANFGEDDRKGCYLFYDDGSYVFKQLDFPKYITYTQHVWASQEEFTKLVEQTKSEKDNVRVKLISDGLIDHSSKKAILQQIGVKVEIDKQDVIINPAEAIDVYKPITHDELKKDFKEWSDEKKPSNVGLGERILFGDTKYYYYHAESDSLFFSYLTYEEIINDGLVEEVSEERAFELMKQLDMDEIPHYEK